MSINNRFSIDEFINATQQQDSGQGLFEFESERILEANVNGMFWMKMGAMIAYRGDVKFTREAILNGGIGKFLKKAVSGEGTRLTKVEGNGKVYLADAGKKITVLDLAGQTMFVNGNDLLAFEHQIQWDIKMMRKITSIAAGGLFNVKLSGDGLIAITSHYDPMTLMVTPGNPIYTDPNATIAWSGSLTPELKTDVSLKTFVGRGSGESIQMKFEGDGFVIVQPFEETPFQVST